MHTFLWFYANFKFHCVPFVLSCVRYLDIICLKDTLTELEVSKSLRKLGINRTRIIVAHRLSTIMNVDHIVVMKQGKKVEEGSFAELMRVSDGAFRSMWERQQRQEQVAQ